MRRISESQIYRYKLITTFFFFLIIVFLWSGCFVSWLRSLSPTRIKPYTLLDCKFLFFFPAFSSEWSSFLLSIMCIEKFFALYFPLKTRTICTVAMAKRVTLVVTLLLSGYNMQHFFIRKSRVYPNGSKRCEFVNVPDNYELINHRVEYTLYSFAPFTIMVLANGAIIYKFMRASCARDQDGTESTNQALRRSANRGTAMLITVSLAFLILTGPTAVFAFTFKPYPNIQNTVVSLLRYVNHSINALLYCASGSRFRTELMKTFPFHLCGKNIKNFQNGPQRISSVVFRSNSTSASEIGITPSPD